MHPRTLLRLNGVVVLAASVLFYIDLGGPWWLFLVLLLAPDLFMLGYLSGPRIGAAIYNLGHTLATPGVVLALGFLTDTRALLLVGAIWTAHIGMDTVFGYGLKYRTGFKDTHLQSV